MTTHARPFLVLASLALAACGDSGGADMGRDPDQGGGDCSVTAAPVAASGQDLVIEALDLIDDRIRLRNVSSEPIDAPDYWYCREIGVYQMFNAGVIPAGGTVTLDLPASLRVDNNSQLSIYETGRFTSVDDIRAFVRWGVSEEMAGDDRQNIAVGAGIWTDGEFVLTEADTRGFVATGDVTVGSGWTATDDPACF
ncbi:MAG: hypothetical protein ACFCGT_21845 [Sandaracinaceae bacterium]